MVDIHVGTGIVLIVISAFSIISSIVNDYLNYDNTRIVRVTSYVLLVVGIICIAHKWTLMEKVYQTAQAPMTK